LDVYFKKLTGFLAQALVVQIVEKSNNTSHLVAIVKVPDAENAANSGESPWYLFNDFTVRNVQEEEAISFPDRWKVKTAVDELMSSNLTSLLLQMPALLYFERQDVSQQLDLSQLPVTMDPMILCRDTSVSM
jgi:hypothetical protein